jgi:hypothetical protein
MASPPDRRSPDRTAQQRGHFFLNIDHDLGFTQFLGEALGLAAQLLVFFSDGIALGLGAALLRRQRLENASFVPLAAPGRQQRRIQAFAAKDRADTAGALGLVGLGQDALFVFGGEAAALGLRHDLGIGVGGCVAAGGTPVTLAPLGLPPSHRRQNAGGRRSGIPYCYSRLRFFLALLCN